MPIDVTAFSALARAEFMKGKLAADERPFPPGYEKFVTTMPSTVKVETHTYMSNLPRLYEFEGQSRISKLVDKTYTVTNKEYRIGPVSVKATDLDDDQIGGYLMSINALPERGKKDIGHATLAHLAAGTTNTGFDGTAFFANSHTVGSGDNLDTYNGAANDSATHKMILLRVDNPIKPVIFQDREALSSLITDADTPQAREVKQFKYWADTRFGLGYGFWWDAYHITITDTPSVGECYEIIRQGINGMRTFTLPKGSDTDTSLYVHEGWVPAKDNLVILCNLKLAEILRTALTINQYVTSTGNVDNVYKDVAELVPTSALGA